MNDINFRVASTKFIEQFRRSMTRKLEWKYSADNSDVCSFSTWIPKNLETIKYLLPSSSLMPLNSAFIIHNEIPSSARIWSNKKRQTRKSATRNIQISFMAVNQLRESGVHVVSVSVSTARICCLFDWKGHEKSSNFCKYLKALNVILRTLDFN